METTKSYVSPYLCITDDEAEAGARMAVRLFDKWGLNDSEGCVILGGLCKQTYSSWKRGVFGRIGSDLRMRLSVLAGIHSGLKHLFTDEERVCAWVKKANTHFDGERPIDVMLKGRLIDLLAVRDYLDAVRC